MAKIDGWNLYAFYVLEYTDGEHSYRISRLLEINDGKELSAEEAQDLLFKEEISYEFGKGESRVEIENGLKRVWDDVDDSRVVEIIEFRLIPKFEFLVLAKYLSSDRIGKVFNPSIRKEKIKEESEKYGQTPK